MMPTRRQIILGAAASALPFGHVRAQSKIKLRVAAHAPYASLHQAVAKAFMENNPGVEIDLDTSQANYDDLAQMILRGAVSGSLPDVAFNGNNRLRIFADRGLAVPVDDLIAADKAAGVDVLPRSVLSIGTLNGKNYGLGFTVSVPVVYYNVDLIRAAGADPSKLPTTWEDILALAAKINDPAAGLLGFFFNYDQLDWFWIALIESQGGRMMSADERRIAFDGPDGLRALQLLKAFGAAGQGQVDMTRNQAMQAFTAGKIGIFVQSSSDVGLYEKQSNGQVTTVVGRFPLLSEKARLPAGGAMSIMFAKDPSTRQAAWDYMKFASGPIGQTIVATQSGYMVANSQVAEDPKRLAPFYAKSPNMKPVIEQLSLLDGWYAYPGANGAKISTVIRDRMRDVVQQRQSPSEALESMSKEVTALLPKG
ncbi:ABC transporter substrate-binding protein [Mesorhizobium retamae]|uniref:ABC transporter substrate-binding protein n=1 Tax=Mesorhizobium retamae TaxID=2912854 RepID=A0ABS9QEX1_9HYPH|nr:ABC transporter substrate-binding protein [Mesorhizobium sp. IRAMC:0171]MCG7505341.1 ABC transporter substrate-binding protein [Mesorhizobium sp. IRAMC:0171]